MSASQPPSIHPWQADQWHRLRARRGEGRLPHAMIVCGPGGTGERAFADAVMQSLLCTAAPETAPCGACAACREFAAGNHPDAVTIEPEESGKAIGIDRIRGLIGRLALTGGGGAKVALIDPAEAMTLQASNSLLKTLEEPPGDSVLLLVSERPARLPATIRSRCQQVTFGLPERSAALEWLRPRIESEGAGHEDAGAWLDRAGGAPLRALELARRETDEAALIAALVGALRDGRVTPDAIAAGARVPLRTSVPLLVAAVEDIIRLRLAPEPRLRLSGERQRLAAAGAGVDVVALFHYLDELKRSIPGPSSALRADIQWQGLLADAAETGRSRQH